MRECQAAWRFRVSVREYRELVEGDAWPSYAVWELDRTDSDTIVLELLH
jgi:hypothetical protein